MNRRADIPSRFVPSTDQGDHPPHLQLHQQRSPAEGRRPPPLRPGSDGGPARQPEVQRAEEQIPASAGTPQQGAHAAVTAPKNVTEKYSATFENEFRAAGGLIPFLHSPSFLSVRSCRFVSSGRINFWYVEWGLLCLLDVTNRVPSLCTLGTPSSIMFGII